MPFLHLYRENGCAIKVSCGRKDHLIRIKQGLAMKQWVKVTLLHAMGQSYPNMGVWGCFGAQSSLIDTRWLVHCRLGRAIRVSLFPLAARG
jgi:hypothetical protein